MILPFPRVLSGAHWLAPLPLPQDDPAVTLRVKEGKLSCLVVPSDECSVGMVCWQGLLGARDHPFSGADSEVHGLPAVLREQHA